MRLLGDKRLVSPHPGATPRTVLRSNWTVKHAPPPLDGVRRAPHTRQRQRPAVALVRRFVAHLSLLFNTLPRPTDVNTKSQRVQCDARAVPANLGGLLHGDVALVVHNAALVQPADAVALARLCAQHGAALHAVVRPEHAARLELAAWRRALQPDLLILQPPGAVDWPQLLVLVPRLEALQLAWRVQLAIGRSNLDDLAAARWQALADVAGTRGVALTVAPRLGADAPPPRALAGRLAALALEPHALEVTRLVPNCAVPRGLPIAAIFGSEARAAALAHAPGCAACVHATRGHCPGLPADLLAQAEAPFGPAAAGAYTADGSAPSAIAAAGESVETTSILLGLRAAWRLDQPIATARELATAAADWFPFAGNGISTHLGMQFREHSSGWFDCTTADPDRQLVYFARDAAAAAHADALERAMADRQAAAALGPQLGDALAASDALDRQLGELFGYPSCCIASVLAGHRAWSEVDHATVAETAWFALAAARASARWDWRLDPTTPLQDTVWIRHYPCRWDCAASLALVSRLAHHQPKRAAKALAERPDATLLWADGTALPLRGTRLTDGVLQAPRILPPSEAGQRAAKSVRAAQALQAQLASAQSVVAAHDLQGPGGVLLVQTDGTRAPLHWPEAPQHADFPRLIVFSPEPLP